MSRIGGCIFFWLAFQDKQDNSKVVRLIKKWNIKVLLTHAAFRVEEVVEMTCYWGQKQLVLPQRLKFENFRNLAKKNKNWGKYLNETFLIGEFTRRDKVLEPQIVKIT